jgi:DNA topoisomerase I
MSTNLVIVESPAKAKTIQKFLGKDFIVKSCNGHIRDLASNKLSINIEKNFEPEYTILDDKEKLVKELKDTVKKTEIVWLATDEDREGEAISWHLATVLGLDVKTTNRIVFHEITNKAIQEAIKTPRHIIESLVDAQQARRVLDRLVGFKLSPILWKKVKPQLSAGRVQSVAVRLIVDKEREIINFSTKSYYKVTAEFISTHEAKADQPVFAELSRRFDDYESTKLFLTDCIESTFAVDSLESKSVKKSPPPPFTTSTLQQEAYRQLGFSVSQTMKLAQTLYEAGHITYMRTDSVKLSAYAIEGAKREITKSFGAEYSKSRNFDTKSKSAQEAHEAIRPTSFELHKVTEGPQENRLYDLIWKRTIASQMSDALIERNTIKISISKNVNYFTVTGEVIKFDGYLKIYSESKEDDEATENAISVIPPLYKGEKLNLVKSQALEKYTRPQPRYNEATLVKKMEELGIGRPSTYAPIISTIQKRGYVEKDTKAGKERPVRYMLLEKGKITDQTKKDNYGAEKNKFFPTDIGMITNDFLVSNFENIIDFNFTARVEDEFDEIAEGNMAWKEMIGNFYAKFTITLDETLKSTQRTTNERYIGIDPLSKEKVYVKFGKFGPYIQLGEKEGETPPKFANLKKGQLLETISLAEALELLKLPKELGLYEGLPVNVNIGKWGPYVVHNKVFYSLAKTDDPYTIELDRAIEVMIAKREQKAKASIKSFEHNGHPMEIIDGRYGPYISYMKKSYRIPKGLVPSTLSIEKCLEIIDQAPEKKERRVFRKASKSN